MMCLLPVLVFEFNAGRFTDARERVGE